MIDSLFGSKTRVKLLHLFLNNPEKSFYVREITRLIDEQINSVRRELANMVSVGIVQSDNIDNKLYYSTNIGYRYLEPLSVIFSDKRNLQGNDSSKVWAKTLSRMSNIKVVISAGKLVGDADGKIDLLLVGDISAADAGSLVKKIEKAENNELNYSVMSYEDFYYRLSVRDRFIMDIIEGKHSVLIDTENILRKE